MARRARGQSAGLGTVIWGPRCRMQRAARKPDAGAAAAEPAEAAALRYDLRTGEHLTSFGRRHGLRTYPVRADGDYVLVDVEVGDLVAELREVGLRRGVGLVRRLEAGDEELMTRLTAGYQEILRAKGSYIEIASSLGIAVGTVRSRLHRARSALVKLRQSRFGHTGNGKTRDMAH